MSSSPSCQNRRTFKTLLRLPTFPRVAGLGLGFNSLIHGIVTKGPRTSLPEDILLAILQDLTTEDILNLSLTSKHLYDLLKPELYRTMHLRSSKACKSGLRLLSSRPDICTHVRKLALRPNYYLAWPMRDSPISEARVAHAVRAIAPFLKRLKTFDWDATEMPEDSMWGVLKSSCPELTELYTNVGYGAFNPDSELFKFSNLTLFSLSVRHGLVESSLFPTREDLPPALWSMLLTRCPNLNELTLCSFSAGTRVFSVDRVVEGTWPALTSLTLGAFGYSADFSLASPPADMPTFLARHGRLADLHLAWNFRRWMSPEDDPTFSMLVPPSTSCSTAAVDSGFAMQNTEFNSVESDSTPPLALTSFSAIVQYLPALASSPSAQTLTTLDLMCEPLYYSRSPLLVAALTKLPALSSLEIWVHATEDDPSGLNLFMQGICEAARGLEDLHFMCTTRFGKKLLSILARTLRTLPYLRTFALTKGHRYADESMRASAMRVFRACAAGSSRISESNIGPGIRGSEANSSAWTPTTQESPPSPDSLPSPSPKDSIRLSGTHMQTQNLPPPTLTQVSVRWARAACRNHLKQEGTYARIIAPVPTLTASTRPKASSRTRSRVGENAGDSEETPKSRQEKGKIVIEACERGIRAVGGNFERRYRFPLSTTSANLDGGGA